MLLKCLKDLRDNVHIWDVKGNEYTGNKYNRDNYNNAMKILQHIDDSLTTKLREFEMNKMGDCFNLLYGEELIGLLG